MAVNAPLGIDPGALAAALGELAPVIPLPLSSPAVDVQLAGWEGTLQGWSLRETGGGASTQVLANNNTNTGAAITATLPDVAGKQTFLTGFDVVLGVPAAAAAVSVSINGATGGAPAYTIEDVAGVGAVFSIRFPGPLPGAALGVTVAAAGGGAAVNSVNVYGYQAGASAIVEFYSGTSVGGLLLATVELAPGG